MSLVFSEIEPAQIDGLWIKYVYGLQEYQSRWPQYVNWTIDDVKQAIRKDTARMVNVYNEGEPIGFMIYRRFRAEFTGKKYFHVWLVSLKPEYRGTVRGFLPEVFEYLTRLAKKDGASYVEFDSPRKGWGKLLDRFSMKPNRVVYRKEI